MILYTLPSHNLLEQNLFLSPPTPLPPPPPSPPLAFACCYPPPSVQTPFTKKAPCICGMVVAGRLFSSKCLSSGWQGSLGRTVLVGLRGAVAGALAVSGRGGPKPGVAHVSPGRRARFSCGLRADSQANELCIFSRQADKASCYAWISCE